MATAFGQMCVNDHLLLTTPEQVQTLMDVLKVSICARRCQWTKFDGSMHSTHSVIQYECNIQVIVNSIFYLVYI